MSCFGMCLRVNDKVSYQGKLCKIIKNHDSGLFRLEEIDGVFEFEAYADEIDSLYSRRCLNCPNDVMPDAERGRCAGCLATSVSRKKTTPEQRLKHKEKRRLRRWRDLMAMYYRKIRKSRHTLEVAERFLESLKNHPSLDEIQKSIRMAN